jgi:hypothetical protein
MIQWARVAVEAPLPFWFRDGFLYLAILAKIDYNASERIFTNKQRDRENLHYR